jgi:hypothetical protein
LLAPDIVEPILEVRANQSPVLERLEGPPASWVEQHVDILEPKTSVSV